jgi:pyrroloquinoline quinone (PQQ) biosynthesis protein C
MSIERLTARLEKEMESLSHSPNLAKVLEPGFADNRLYAIYLTETYHYTKHNSRNQALVAARKDDMSPQYMKYCLHHAEEEVGHELMASHDIKAMGFDIKESELPKPLKATTALTAYLYWVAEYDLPVARLGYSFWAERSYEYIKPLLSMISDGLGVPKKAMTFFNEHSEIDAKHAEEVVEAINRFVKTEEEWQAVEDVMINSLLLTTKMMDEVLEEFVNFKESGETRYSFLK